MSARQRNIKSSQDRPARRKMFDQRKRQTAKTNTKLYLGLAALSVLLVGTFVLFRSDSEGHSLFRRALDLWGDVNESGHLLGNKDKLYAIMMDAGSTGTRVLVFTFEKSKTDGSLKLVHEFFKEEKPGISFYVDEPEKAALSVEGLLNEGKAQIPHSAWRKTPAALKATAGLRLLPKEKAQNILDVITKVFDDSGLLEVGNAVEIMDGTSEGLNSWFTLNLLLGRLNGPKESTVASLDLGGGSTQVSFVPNQQRTLDNVDPSHLTEVSLGKEKVKFYVHSYLGMGLMAGRLKLLRMSNMTEEQGSTLFQTPCFAVGQKETWKFNGKEYTIIGPDSPLQETEWIANEEPVRPESFYQCWRFASLISFNSINRVQELEDRDILAMSYYYDRAVENELIHPLEGGKVRVKQFGKAAAKACSLAKPIEPFACLDLSFIYGLLQKGYQLSDDKEILLKKKIDGHETSWALGAAYQMLQTLQLQS